MTKSKIKIRNSKFRWLAAGWDSPLHLCVERNGVAATLCGAKPKRLFVTRPTATRCQDCAQLEKIHRLASRALFFARLRSAFRIPRFAFFNRSEVAS